MKLKIDNQTVTAQANETILDCALRHGIDIPHLCTHSNLSPYGACRMCVVEIEGMRGYPTSCTTPAADDMVVSTNTPALRELRRNILALMMLEHPSACLVCDKRDLCSQYRPHAEKAGRTTGCHTCSNKEICQVRSLSEQLGFKELPVQPAYHHRPLDRSNPFIDRDLNLCILCGRCVRICQHHQNRTVIDFINRGSETYIGQAFDCSLKDAGCQFCGSCIDVCPTGTLAERYAKWYGKPDTFIESTCIFCDAACALKLATHNDKLVTAQALNEDVPVCLLGRFALPEFLNHPDRLSKPLVRIGKVLRPTEWDQALEAASAKLKNYQGDSFALVCDTTSTLEDRYLFKKFTNDVMNSPHYLEIEPNPRGVSLTSLPKGVKAVLLTGAFVASTELDNLDFIIVQDCFPTKVSEHADVVFPAAAFAEVEGTTRDASGQTRPLNKASDPPGQSQPDWWIINSLAQSLGENDFKYDSTTDIRREMKLPESVLCPNSTGTPPVAQDIRLRRTHFRGHRLDEKVFGLRELPADDASLPPTQAPTKSDQGFTILKKSEIAPNVHEIVIAAPHIAAKALPGQFIIVMVDEKSERVPFTLSDWDPEQGTITLVVLEVGQSSRKLILLNEGDKIAHVTGPLGIPLEIKNYGTVALVAGCYGIGAILKIAESLQQAGNRVITVVEARSHYKHYYWEKLQKVSDDFIQTTMDGSLNIKGHALDVIAAKLKDNEKLDLVIAIGCPFMMMLTARETKPFGVKTLVALNPIMLDGTGMCGACRVTVGSDTKFACVDGPFFDAHLVDWEELRDRRVAYSEHEINLVGRTESVTPNTGHSHTCKCH